MMRALVIGVVIVGGVVAGARRADACSCLARSEAEQLEAHDLVFTGKVATVTPGDDNMERTTFTIDAIEKGAVDARTVIEYGTDTAACGLGHLAVGTPMKMYVNTTDDGTLEANLYRGVEAPRFHNLVERVNGSSIPESCQNL